MLTILRYIIGLLFIIFGIYSYTMNWKLTYQYKQTECTVIDLIPKDASIPLCPQVIVNIPGKNSKYFLELSCTKTSRQAMLHSFPAGRRFNCLYGEDSTEVFYAGKIANPNYSLIDIVLGLLIIVLPNLRKRFMNPNAQSFFKTQKKHLPPPQVIWAVRLFWLSFGLSIISMVFNWKIISNAAPIGFIILLYAVTFGFCLWLVYKILKGRNWARIFFLCMMILGLVQMDYVDMIKHFSILNMLNILTILLSIVSLYLLFTKESGNWFKKNKL